MRLSNVFSTPIWTSKVLITDDIIKQCNSVVSNSGRVISNVGGFQSELLEESTFPELSKELYKIIDQVSFQVDRNFKLVIDSYWVNVNNKGHYNKPHVHPLSCLSGVVYISCDENTGNIKFDSGSLMEHYPINTFNSKLFQDSIEYQPQVGDVLIFPAWIYHSVLPNNSDTTRISIAFNMRQV